MLSNKDTQGLRQGCWFLRKQYFANPSPSPNPGGSRFLTSQVATYAHFSINSCNPFLQNSLTATHPFPKDCHSFLMLTMSADQNVTRLSLSKDPSFSSFSSDAMGHPAASNHSTSALMFSEWLCLRLERSSAGASDNDLDRLYVVFRPPSLTSEVADGKAATFGLRAGNSGAALVVGLLVAPDFVK